MHHPHPEELEWIETCRKLFSERQPQLKVHPEVWTFTPWGHRLVFLRKPPDEKTSGGIVIPESAKGKMTTGWIISVGAEICKPDLGRYPSVCPYEHPHDLVGMSALIGFYGGVPLRFDAALGREYESDYVIITIGDVLGAEWPLDNKEIT
jgi:hypothetical protein